MIYSLYQVIQETLRAASILSFTFREAVEDVEFEGYFIPKGWKILPLFRSIHHHEDFFPTPDKFDPSRFEVSLSLSSLTSLYNTYSTIFSILFFPLLLSLYILYR